MLTFNGIIPIIAIQMKTIRVGDTVSLIFSTVLDELSLGTLEEDQDIIPTDRNFWLKKTTKDILGFCDLLLEDISEFASGYQLKYNKYYIGLSRDGIAMNFVSFTPRKSYIIFTMRIDQEEEITNSISETDLDALSYDRQWKQYRIRLTKEDYDGNKELLISLMKKAYDQYPYK
jgi:hypothetical protein